MSLIFVKNYGVVFEANKNEAGKSLVGIAKMKHGSEYGELIYEPIFSFEQGQEKLKRMLLADLFYDESDGRYYDCDGDIVLEESELEELTSYYRDGYWYFLFVK